MKTWKWMMGMGGLTFAMSAALETPSEAAPAIPALRTAAPACTTVVMQDRDDGAEHAVTCSPLTFAFNPATSGTHFSNWAAYKTYTKPVPEGFLVHSLEHGAVVVGYDCPDGCPAEVAMAEAWIASLGTDALCPGQPHKVILAPNPGLAVRWAATAWTWSIIADCLDTAALGTFFRAHYGKTPESPVCGGGTDLSAVGWCPAPTRRPDAEEGNLSATPGISELWSGTLAGPSRLRLEVARADGSLLEARDLGAAGPGPARAEWDAQAFRLLHPGAGAVVIRIRTAEGRELARKTMLLP